MSRMDDRRKKIQNYVDTNRNDNLYFKRTVTGEIVQLSATNTDDLIMEILQKAEDYWSWSESGFETTPGRLRSSLDIWRHAKTALPDIDIFRVMEAIYRLKDKVYGHYCYMVHRSVFRLPDTGSWSVHRQPIGFRNFICREYKIKFSTWKKLHTPLFDRIR